MARQLTSSVREEVRAACNNGRLKEALQILNTINQSAFVDSSAYTSLLHGCVKEKSLAEGKLVHAHMAQTGFQADGFIENTLLNMYAKCGCLMDARRVFDHMAERSVVSWTMMITAYVTHRLPAEALALFHKMQRVGIQPNNFTFSSVLPACAAIQHGRQIHEDIIRSGWCQSDVVVENALLDMYAKCGDLEDARKLFDKMSQRNVVSWNSMIAGYAQNENFDDAEELFREMPGRDVVSWTIMVTGYARNGYVDEALKLFWEMPQRDAVSWNAIIAGFAQNGHGEEAIDLYKQMQSAKVRPNSETFASVLSACADLSYLEQGQKIHEDVCRHGFQTDAFVGSALVDMYAKCGSIDDACEVFGNIRRRDVVLWNAMVAAYAKIGNVEKAGHLFQTMPERDVSSWNAMIGGYAQSGHFEEALKLYGQMQLTDAKPNSETFATVLSACANLEALEQGKEVHRDIIKSRFQWDLFVGSALLDMYAKCGSIKNAHEVFSQMPQHDVVSWNAMITGYARCGDVDEALKFFLKMPQQDTISWNAIIAGYALNGHINKAKKLFQKMPGQDVPSWNVMISGYAHNGNDEEALNLYQQMQFAGVKPTKETLAIVLPSCANMAALEQGKEVHEAIIRSGYHSDVFVGSALIDMYAKCGTIDDAHKVFDKMTNRDVVLWTSMIVGYAMHGCGNQAIQLFEQMKNSGTKPDYVTFVGVLSACCHAGLVNEGRQYFDCMIEYHHITPRMEHYCCMVDLLGRAGHLDEVQDFINNMPIKPDIAVWGSLLGACRIHVNIELGERVAEQLFVLDPENSAPYLQLSNIYATVGRWDDIEKVRNLMKTRRVKKQAGCSWIEVNKQLHAFLAGDRSNPTNVENLY